MGIARAAFLLPSRSMKVGVIGSGSIGPDLAYGFVSALGRTEGARVFLVDIRKEALDAGMARIGGYIEKGLARGKLSPRAAAAVQAALVPTLDLSVLAGCEYVLEAASEDLPIKQKILADLERTVSPDCLIGFATSGLPRKQIAAGARHPERCFVNHPFYPAWRSLPVEVVSSGDAAYEARMLETLRKLGKVPIMTADVPCFAADDIFCNYICEAVRLVEAGIATPAQIDRIVDDAIGGGGPFNVMDATVGNLLTAHCQELMMAEGGPEFAPPALLVKQGKTPWHDRREPGDPRYDAGLAKTVLDRILAMLVKRTTYVVERGICAPTELNWMTQTALGFRPGTVEIAREHGAIKAPFYKTITVTRDQELAVVSVFRPEVRNALSAVVIKEIDHAMTALLGDSSVRGIVLTSFDGALAGADINELAALASPDACREVCLATHRVLARISGSAKPIVCAVDGPVLGGGAEFAMACHARVVGNDLVLGQPEVNLGILPGYGGTQRLPRLIGWERAQKLIRTAASIGAREACEWGWASGQPAKDVLARAKELLREHLAGRVRLEAVSAAPLALPDTWPTVDIGHRSRKIDSIVCDVMKRGLRLPLDQGLHLEAEGFARCKATVDMDIGMKNFTQNGPRVPAVFLHE